MGSRRINRWIKMSRTAPWARPWVSLYYGGGVNMAIDCAREHDLDLPIVERSR